MTPQARPDTDAPKAAPGSEPEPACVASVLGAVCAAIGLAAVVWTTYNAFDHNGFDVRAAVVTPVLTALGLEAEATANPMPSDATASR
ncbi:MAG: hypothetical protein EOP78_05970 [Variovorax sp.]|nr:MAG: hypothetical protein EOP78_05970 [Variovorax sp.]